VVWSGGSNLANGTPQVSDNALAAMPKDPDE
jgi:hypothetical protein